MSANLTPEGNPSLDPKLDLINRARDVLRGERMLSSAELKKLYLTLENQDQFSYATEILLVKMAQDEAAGMQISVKEFQTLAKYIYKDHSLPSSFKFTRALQVISAHTELPITNKSETLGLTAAVYKRKWQFDHQYKNLVLSCYYYRRGYENWIAYIQDVAGKTDDDRNDDGYTAINYAYINELMGVDKLEEHGSVTGITDGIIANLKEAKAVREKILLQFIQPTPEATQPVLTNPGSAPWIIATAAEAYFGLRKYAQAAAMIQQYLALPSVRSWEIRTFSQQLFSIAYLQLFQQKFLHNAVADSPGKAALTELTKGTDENSIKECLVLFAPKTTSPSSPTANSPEIKRGGKLGLALSGGGFRASLFHIGVLAALAEKDELRHVQVISCVSGGSIIGAYYYLKLKRLLETKKDDDISTDDYVGIVQEIETEFTGGVQKNLRIRIFSNLWCNLKMLRYKKYSRTHRMGELYDKHLFSRAWEKYPDYKPPATGKDGTLCMNDLYITPPGGNFNMAVDNWSRKNKIPQLVLNATSVNTGHNWQFTASWMGEPPGNIQADIDVKPRLRRMYYQEAPGEFKKFRLGYAVGASSCVPVMFHPMPLHGLYPDIDLQLIDGGLHDNQGIAALIEEECKNMIISDASGQLPTSIVASNNEAATFYRADNILQERLRELQFLDIKERYNTTQLNMLITTHLKSDLQTSPIRWKYCKDPARKIVYGSDKTEDTDLTRYGILRNVQTMLSEIRTDLDSFHDIESTALMYSGYQQIHYEYKIQQPEALDPQENLWAFSAIKDCVTIPAKAALINNQLSTGKKLAFKVVYLSIPLRVFLIIVGVAAAAGLLYLGYIFWNDKIVTITVRFVVYMFIGFLLGLVSKFVAALFSYKTTLRKYAGLILLLTAAWVFCNIYLWVFNPMYNKAGELKRNRA